jgi:hypothetical protein
MTQPACSTCGAHSLLWDEHLDPAGPCRENARGSCYSHAKDRARENGGLAVARLEQRPLDLLLASFTRADEDLWTRMTPRGVRYVLELGGMRQELTT